MDRVGSLRDGHALTKQTEHLVHGEDVGGAAININSDGAVMSRKAKPPDGGWGWLVLFGAFYVAATLVGVLPSFGIIFSEQLTRMRVSSTTIGWMVNIYIFLWNISFILVPSLCEIFSWRSVSFTGYFVASVAYMLMCFAESVVSMFLLFSVTIGLSGGISTAVCLLVVPEYFDKRRGTALAILMTGSTIGQIILPLLLRGLSDEYGFKGSTLIFGGILANCCVAAMVYHPIEWHQRKEDMTEESLSMTQNNTVEIIRTQNRRSNNSKWYTKKKPNRSVSYIVTTLSTTIIEQFKHIKQSRLTLANLSFACFIIGYANFIAQLPFSMGSLGHSPQTVSYCISISSIANAVSRIIICVVCDRTWFNRNICFLCGTILAGGSSIVIVFVQDNVQLVLIAMVVWNLGIAGTMSVFYTLLLDISGRTLYASAVSMSGFFLAVIGISLGPFTGLIQDASSYSWSLAFCGALQLLSSLLWCLMPLAIIRDKRLNELHNETQ